MRPFILAWSLLTVSLLISGVAQSNFALQDDALVGDQDQSTELLDKLQENFWLNLDRNGRIREKAPQLPEKIRELTLNWINKLSESDLELLTADGLSKEAEKQARELEKKYRSDARDLVTHHQLAEKLAQKVIETHWKGMEKLNVTPESFPDYTSQYNQTVLSWFHGRTIEDLSIFEKPRPKPNERERGEKITAELLKAIEDVQQKYQSNWKTD
jgi:hypothetical protein